MYNIIDTITLSMTCARGYKVRNFFTGKLVSTLDWTYAAKMQQKITKKMIIYEKDKNNMSKYVWTSKYKAEKADVNYHKYYKGYYFNYFENWHSLTVMIPHHKLESHTAKEIINNVTTVILDLFELDLEDLNEIVLNRIDIKCDFRYADDEEYTIIKSILSKVVDNYYCYQKEILQNDEKGYILTFSRPTNGEVRKGIITASTKKITNKAVEKENEKTEDEDDIGSYMQIVEYNKTLQIENDIANGRVPESYREKYINVFRTEVRIRNARLNYYKNRKCISKTLEYYSKNYDLLVSIYNKATRALFGTNDFFRIDEALDIINSNKSMRISTKNKLCELLQLVNQKGITAAKGEWDKKFCPSTFINHKKKIESLGINIITFDRTINNKVVSVEMIKNFTLLKNRIPDCYDGKVIN